MNVYEQIISEIVKNIKLYLCDKHIKFDKDADNERILLDFFDNRNKWITSVPRTVILSNELKYKIQTKTFFGCTLDDAKKIVCDFECIKAKFENGEDVNWNSSTKIFSACLKYQDILLNTWNIRHLHLNQQNVSSKSGMKRNRSKVLLFYMLYKSYVYCIDIMQHPENDKFLCYNFLKILHKNGWMNLIGFTPINDENYIAGSLKPKITDDSVITKLYTDYKTNLAFKFEGNVYIKLNGLASTGDILINSQELLSFKRNIEKYLFDDDKFIELQDFNINNENKLITTIIVIERNGAKMKFKIIL